MQLVSSAHFSCNDLLCYVIHVECTSALRVRFMYVCYCMCILFDPVLWQQATVINVNLARVNNVCD